MDLRDNVESRETENYPELFYVPIPDEAPCKREQEKLSGVVKNLHRKLRRKYREGKQPQWAPLFLWRPAAEWLILNVSFEIKHLTILRYT